MVDDARLCALIWLGNKILQHVARLQHLWFVLFKDASYLAYSAEFTYHCSLSTLSTALFGAVLPSPSQLPSTMGFLHKLTDKLNHSGGGSMSPPPSQNYGYGGNRGYNPGYQPAPYNAPSPYNGSSPYNAPAPYDPGYGPPPQSNNPPYPWTAAWDPHSQQTYYVNGQTGERSWMPYSSGAAAGAGTYGAASYASAPPAGAPPAPVSVVAPAPAPQQQPPPGSSSSSDDGNDLAELRKETDKASE